MYKELGPFLISRLLAIPHICPNNSISRMYSKIFPGLKLSISDIISSKVQAPLNFRLLTPAYRWHSPIMCLTVSCVLHVLHFGASKSRVSDP